MSPSVCSCVCVCVCVCLAEASGGARASWGVRRVKTACWVGDCFIYTNSANRLNYYVGGQINTAAHFDR
jgi:hypothetical protein